MVDFNMADGFFLSPSNPLATRDQREVEDRALRLLEHPEMRRAREQVQNLFRWVMTADLGSEIAEFGGFVDEYMFHYAMRAANNDPNFPRIARFMTPPHHWFGRDLPGSRWAGDSPDFIYRVATVSHGPRYEIRGRATSETAPSMTYSLLADRQASSVIFSTLDGVDMDVAADGTFTLTIDPSAPNGRRNHIQSQAGCYAIWIRDALGDWSKQIPNALRIVRIEPPSRAPLSDEELALWGARAALDGVYYLYFLTRTSWLMPANEIRPPAPTSALGGMPKQIAAGARLQLGSDDAMIITTTAAGALFRNIVLTESYWRTWNYWDRQTSLNSGQMIADEDGRYTFLIAHEDVGVHNWLDACGRGEIRLGHRWQSFEQGDPVTQPEFCGRLVKLAEVDQVLSPGVRRIDAAGRRDQITRRKAGFEARFIDS